MPVQPNDKIIAGSAKAVAGIPTYKKLLRRLYKYFEGTCLTSTPDPNELLIQKYRRREMNLVLWQCLQTPLVFHSVEKSETRIKLKSFRGESRPARGKFKFGQPFLCTPTPPWCRGRSLGNV